MECQLKESKFGYFVLARANGASFLGLLELAHQNKSERICAILVLSISVERSCRQLRGPGAEVR